MELKHLLGYIALMIFLVLFVFTRNRRRTYLLFVLYAIPLIDVNVTPEYLGYYAVFDVVSYIALVFLAGDMLKARRVDFYLILFLVFIVLISISALRSQFVIESILYLFRIISIFIYSALLLKECRENALFTSSVVKAVRVAVLVSAFFLVMQTVLGPSFTFYGDLNQNIFDSNIMRYPGFFQDPQVFAQFMSISSFLLLMGTEQDKKRPYLKYVFFLVCVIVLLLSGGRSGFLGMVIGFALLIIFGGYEWKISGLALAALAALVFLSFPSMFSMFNRQESVNESYQVRHAIWQESLNVSRLHPYWGIGGGNYLSYTKLYSLDGYYIINDDLVYYGTENGYLKLLAEFGVPGLILSLLFIVIPVLKGFASYFRKSNLTILFLVSAIIGWSVSFVTIYSLSDKRLFVLLATVICMLIYYSNKNDLQENA